MLCLNFFQQVNLMDKFCKVWINKYSSNSSTGCVLEVDLYYKKLHDLRNDYPLAPVKLEIDKKMSDYQLKMLTNIIFLLIMLKSFNKEKCALYYDNLQPCTLKKHIGY